MKQLTFFLFFVLLMNIGCVKESNGLSEVDECYIDLGLCSLHPSSINANPYQIGETMFFVDSLLDTMIIRVT